MPGVTPRGYASGSWPTWLGLPKARAYQTIPGLALSGATKPIAELLWRRTIANADAVTVEARANIPRERPDAEVIPMGLDLTIFKPDLGAPVPYRILAVAALLPRKGLDVLIEALALAVKEAPKLHLVIAGEGPQKSVLELLATERGVASHVEFLGRVPRRDLPALYCSAAVFCHAARSDNFPTAVIEAMACGRPVLVSDSGALPEMVADTGIVHEAGKARALARQLVMLTANESLRKELGAAARDRAISNYSDQKMSDRYIQLYDRLQRRHAGAGFRGAP